MFLGLVSKQDLFFRESSGKVKSYFFLVPNSSLCLPLESNTTGSSEQLGASEAWALWELCQGERPRTCFSGWTGAWG